MTFAALALILLLANPPSPSTPLANPSVPGHRPKPSAGFGSGLGSGLGSGEVSPQTSPQLPPLQTLIAAGLKQVQRLEAQARRWQRRARGSAWLPLLAITYDYRKDRGWQLDQRPNSADELGVDQGRGQALRIRATWDLARTVYSGEEVRIAQAQLDLADYRANLAREIAALYREALEIAQSEVDKASKTLQLDLVLVQLRALTGLPLPSAADFFPAVAGVRSPTPLPAQAPTSPPVPPKSAQSDAQNPPASVHPPAPAQD